MSATPGSETLWSVHSGQYRVMCRLASSTMSWKRRSSRFGAGKLMLSPVRFAARLVPHRKPAGRHGARLRSRRLPVLRDHVERMDQVAMVVGRAHGVRDLDPYRDALPVG